MQKQETGTVLGSFRLLRPAARSCHLAFIPPPLILSPVEDSNLRHPVCRTDVLAAELTGGKAIIKLAVGSGIEPLSSRFQHDANPSQLSDR
ncbi:MAG: hypothetical protein QOJ64_496 [Acidobacteriota bacterium]|nr:hypothetical protein [Acidobacteriota bacterium]